MSEMALALILLAFMLGAYAALAFVWHRQSRPRDVYWREDEAMAECPHLYPICLDCGAPLEPDHGGVNIPPVLTSTNSVSRGAAA